MPVRSNPAPSIIAQIVTAAAGRTVARTLGGAAAGPVGMLIGAALPAVARRIGPLGMAGMAVGAFVASRLAADAEAKRLSAETDALAALTPPAEQA